MKTKLTLTIIGTIMVLQAILYSAFASSSIDMMFNVGEEAATLAVLFQYAITPAFLMIGLMLLFLRDIALEYAKKLLLAVIIAYIPLFLSFYMMANSPLTQMGISDFAIDIVMFGLAVFTYLKPKGA
ncbi:MAG: hypothetical protein ACJ0QE_02760 [Flavobacteriaceae bacterium]|jgi:hypothetical protein|nr:hypothetical protein [Flavobacteriaceae bacterium]MCH1609412.1 hypothetical protein [Flavobacteriaceae bacterium]MDG1968774.1 hypothetical protein [Flavobacteriaceae bacterium]HCZ09416.1 hypothetical protein [Flavobacteriaceae bacterium]|tara:strand:- start:354 stop:734 length:381 start_codon:yes stop_codon:yes gene_type:complete